MPREPFTTQDKTVRYLAMKIANAGGHILFSQVTNKPAKIGVIHESWMNVLVGLQLVVKDRDRYTLTFLGADLAKDAKEELPAVVVTPKGELQPFPQWAFPPIYNKSAVPSSAIPPTPFLTRFECIHCKGKGGDCTNVWGGDWDSLKNAFVTTCNVCETQTCTVPSPDIIKQINEGLRP